MVSVGSRRDRCVGRSRRMIRKNIKAEIKAAHDYEALEHIVPPKQKPVIRHIKREEQHHRKELAELVE